MIENYEVAVHRMICQIGTKKRQFSGVFLAKLDELAIRLTVDLADERIGSVRDGWKGLTFA